MKNSLENLPNYFTRRVIELIFYNLIQDKIAKLGQFNAQIERFTCRSLEIRLI